MIERRRYVAGLVAVTLFAVLLWLQPLLTLRLPHQVDLLVHLRWSDQFFSALRDGWLLPRWAYASHGGVDKRRFEMYALAASIIGKCHFCVKSHAENLVADGMSATQLRDVGRIAAVINAAALVIAAEGK